MAKLTDDYLAELANGIRGPIDWEDLHALCREAQDLRKEVREYFNSLSQIQKVAGRLKPDYGRVTALTGVRMMAVEMENLRAKVAEAERANGLAEYGGSVEKMLSVLTGHLAYIRERLSTPTAAADPDARPVSEPVDPINARNLIINLHTLAGQPDDNRVRVAMITAAAEVINDLLNAGIKGNTELLNEIAQWRQAEDSETAGWVVAGDTGPFFAVAGTIGYRERDQAQRYLEKKCAAVPGPWQLYRMVRPVAAQ